MKKKTLVFVPMLLLLRLWQRLWLRVGLMAVLAVLTSVVTVKLETLLPGGLRSRIGPEAVLPVLTILASGMLAVSTFSLNVMVAAYRAAADQATPRAHRILLADTTTQNVLATFIGAFVYALSAIILLKSGANSEDSAVISMGVTCGVVVFVVLAMLRWIDHLSDLGSMGATLRTIEDKAWDSLCRTRTAPCLSASPLTDDVVIPADAMPIRAPASGYVQLINMSAIDKDLKGPGAHVWLTAPPGSFVLTGQTIGHASGVDKRALNDIQSRFGIGDYRTFEQDATFGLLVLSESASKALSPGINDAGTAIDVIARQERLLWTWAHTDADTSPPKYPRIFMAPIDPDDLIRKAFASTARDGAAMIEVVRRLLHALDSLQGCADPGLANAARDMAALTRAHAQQALRLDREKRQLAEDQS